MIFMHMLMNSFRPIIPREWYFYMQTLGPHNPNIHVWTSTYLSHGNLGHPTYLTRKFRRCHSKNGSGSAGLHICPSCWVSYFSDGRNTWASSRSMGFAPDRLFSSLSQARHVAITSKV